MISAEERKIIDSYFERIGLLIAGTEDGFCVKPTGWGVGDSNERAKVLLMVFVDNKIHEYMQSNEFFTICVLPEKYDEKRKLFRNQYEKNMDKVEEAGFTVFQAGESITFREAELTLVCRKLFAKNPNKIGDLIFRGKFEHDIYVAELVRVIYTG